MSDKEVDVREPASIERNEMDTVSEIADEFPKKDIFNSTEQNAELSFKVNNDIDKNVDSEAISIAEVDKNNIDENNSEEGLNERTNHDPEESKPATEVNSDSVKVNNDTDALNDDNLLNSESDNLQIGDGISEISDVNLNINDDKEIVDKPNEEIHQNGPSTADTTSDLEKGEKNDKDLDISEVQQINDVQDDGTENDKITEIEKNNELDILENTSECNKEKDIPVNSPTCDMDDILLTDSGKDVPVNNFESVVNDESVKSPERMDIDIPAINSESIDRDDPVKNIDCDMNEDIPANNSDFVDRNVSPKNPDCDMEEDIPLNNSDCNVNKDVQLNDSDCNTDKDVQPDDSDCNADKDVRLTDSDCNVDKDVRLTDSDCNVDKDVLGKSSDCDMDEDGTANEPDCDLDVKDSNCDDIPIDSPDAEKDVSVKLADSEIEDVSMEKSDEEKDVILENLDCDKGTDTFDDKPLEMEKDNLEINQGDDDSASEDCDMAENNPDDDDCDTMAEENPICHADDDALHEIHDEDKSDENLLEKSSNDIPHASDPFDDLLENDKNETTSDTLDHQDSSIAENDLDNHLLDDDLAPVIDEGEAAHVADINHGQGADEEVCLLPDTEREITEADKLKALAGKKTIDIDSSANAYDSLTKGTDDITEMKDEVMTDVNDETHAEEIDGHDQSCDHGAEDDIEDESLREVPEKENEEEHATDESIDGGIIQEIVKVEQTCFNCAEVRDCVYRMLVNENEMKYLCTKSCVNTFQESHPDKYTITHRKVTVSEINPVFGTCIQCKIEKKCFYRVTSGSEITNICQEECLQLVINENLEKYKLRKKKKWVTEIDEKEEKCFICSKEKSCRYETTIEGDNKYICDDECLEKLQDTQPTVFRVKRKKVMKPRQPMLKLKVISNATDKYLDEGNKIIAKTPAQAEAARLDRDRSFLRKCAHCNEPYIGNDKNLSWETMDFCNEICLGKYQNAHGLHCANCKNAVSMVSLGKYCVRFGYDIRQFCCSGCLDEFKKGLKICCYCQRDISADYEGFLAPVGDQGQFKDFCSQFCVEKFDQMSKNPVPPPVWAQCAVCSKEKPTQLEVAVGRKNTLRLCSEPCFAAFKFVNTVFPDQCRWCKIYFERKSAESYTIYTEATAHCFCSKTCMNVYISNSRHIVPCNWCKVKKYNFDMIKKTLENGQSMMMCSLNCLTLYQVSVNAVSSRRIKCDQCKRCSQAQYHLTMSDATVRNFCTYQCVMSFQRQYTKSPMVTDGDSQAVPTGAPRRTYSNQKIKTTPLKKAPGRPSGLPVISNVQSLATPPTPSNLAQVSGHATRAKSKKILLDKPKPPPSPPPAEPPKAVTPPPPPPPKIFNHVVFKPAPPKEVRNMSTLTKPLMVTKGVSCRPHPCSKEVQTDDHLQRRILIPIPVPIYVPTPMAMYSLPLPIPVPIPLPIPIPVFIPTTRNSANGIMKEIKKIHDKMPTDPFEAELLMMAEMVAGDKKKCESDSESEDENGDDGFSPVPMDTGNSGFGEDVLQMALKMATEYEEPAVDLESAMTASTITPSSHPTLPVGLDENSPLHHHQLIILEQQRAAAAAAAVAANAVGRKRGAQGGASPVNAAGSRSKRSRRNADPPPPTHHAPPEPPREPQEKPDANMCLKYTFGVNAWKQWVMTKNAEMEKSSVRRKPFKSEILQLTADELNYSLCLFVKEVRKPNGSEYAPDTIYYLVLGIQQYLFENGRIDNIFTDSYYEKFTECLDEVARKFSVLYNDSQYIVTRVEEEHLWESKQLGAHSPHVLLSTLMFFNTKHFNLVTVEEHMQLSFSHIMKHWKRNPNQPGAAKIPGARNVLLRFYPPQAALEANSRKKKVYEQQENEENPLRCPVKLYEFYISKCPESVKTRNDVFYLMPERSCVPDSPVWYSTQALGREPLSKMLHRVKMVKEINIALLTS